MYEEAIRFLKESFLTTLDMQIVNAHIRQNMTSFEIGQKVWCSVAWDKDGYSYPMFEEVEISYKIFANWYEITVGDKVYETNGLLLFQTKDAMIDEQIRLLREDIETLERFRTGDKCEPLNF